MKNLNKKELVKMLTNLKLEKNLSQFDNLEIKNNGIKYNGSKCSIFIKANFADNETGLINRVDFINCIKNDIPWLSLINNELKTYGDIVEQYNKKFSDSVVFTVTNEFLDLYEFISKDRYNERLTGFFLGNDICATNAHILKTIDTQIFKEFNTIVNKIALKVLPLEQFFVSYHIEEGTSIRQFVKFENNNYTFIFDTIDSNYVQYKSVIPQDNTNVVIFSKKQLLSELKKCSVFYNKATKMVVFDIKKESVCINAVDIDFNRTYKNELSANTKDIHENLEIGFNACLLEIILKSIDTDVIKFNLDAPNRAGLINETSLIMPVLVRI